MPTGVISLPTVVPGFTLTRHGTSWGTGPIRTQRGEHPSLKSLKATTTHKILPRAKG